MTGVRLERHLPHPPDRVFAFVTEEARVLTWWGHDATEVVDPALSFEREGPWRATLRFPDGREMTMAGHVTHVDRPRSVGFTWRWSGADDWDDAESHVTIRLDPAPDGGTDLTLDHVRLPEATDWPARQTKGWGSTLTRLEAALAANAKGDAR